MGGGGEPTRPTAPAGGAPRSAPAADVPARIGHYAILRVLGEGGMGTVYEAQQESPKRAVALKIIRAGYLAPALLRRFELESHVLGRLQHPGIAQVYEAGVVRDERGGDLPFFAMEFIKGVPLTDYATQRSLGTRERLELLARVCDAVYHAHQKGVIHRDLKPANILVDDSGQPKILDFGVARATDSDLQQTTMQTDVGAIIGTVPYMSPEQVGGDPDDLDTRSDVYALGVIAYELLAERLPYDLQRKMIHEAARIIREEEPTRLSSINRALRGDVETIVAHALEKDKVRRYQSAETLASDIRRYLKHETITARPASTWYQLQKFSRRNRGLVTGLVAAFLLLIAGVIGTSIGLRQAVRARDAESVARKEADTQRDAAVAARSAEEQQRKTAEAQRDKAEKIAEFMSDTLEGAGPSVALGRDITMLKEMMDAAAARIDRGDLKDAPEAELRLRSTIGSTYRELALYQQASQLLAPVASMSRALYEGDHRDTAAALTAMALLLRDRGDPADSEPLMRESLAVYERLSQGDHGDTATAMNNLALVLQDQNKLPEAERLYRDALGVWERLAPGDSYKVATTLTNLASLIYARGDWAEAEHLCREALSMKRRLFSGDHPDVANGLNNLAQLLVLSDPAGAEELGRESLSMFKRLFPGDSPEVATSLHNLALLLKGRQDLAGAEQLCRDALDMRTRLFSEEHPSIAASMRELAYLAHERGDMAGAEPLYREALAMRKRLFHGDHPYVAASLRDLAEFLRVAGKLVEAEALFREAVGMYQRLKSSDPLDLAICLNNLAFLLYTSGDLSEAEPIYRQSLDLHRRALPQDHHDIATIVNNLSALLLARGDPAGAEPLAREGVAMYERTLGRDHWNTGNARLKLGRSLTGMGLFPEAEPELVETERVLSSARGVPAGRHAQAIEALVALYESWDKADPGKGYDAKAAEWRAKLGAVTPPPEPAAATSPAPK